MYQGKHYQKTEHVEKRSRAGKPLAVLIALVLILGAAVGTTLAYLIDRTDDIVNTFTPSKVNVIIEENFDGSTKSDVKFKNTGDVSAYIRATYVVTWKDADGNVSSVQPQLGVDYTISLPNGSSSWRSFNGYWYWTVPVSPGESTGVMISSCQPIEDNAPEGYSLSVDILASAIQSVPAEAIGQAWGVSIAEGSVTAYNAGN